MMHQPQGKHDSPRREVLTAAAGALVTTLIVEGVPRLMDWCNEKRQDAKKAKRKRKKK